MMIFTDLGHPVCILILRNKQTTNKVMMIIIISSITIISYIEILGMQCYNSYILDYSLVFCFFVFNEVNSVAA